MIVEARVTLPFSYAAGSTGSRFLEALRAEGKILAARCSGCGRVLVPASSLCGECGERTDELVEVGPAGTLVAAARTGSANHRPAAFPGAFCLVRLDGADTDLVHWLLGDHELVPGSRVRAMLADERCGSILDIVGFQSAGGQT